MRSGHWRYTIPLRIRSLFWRRHVEGELDEEMRYHLERQIEANMHQGMNAGDARHAAMRSIGGLEQHKEACRDSWGMALVDSLAKDTRYAFRGLRRHKGFAIAAVLTLALGIGANAAIFSVVYGVLLRPLPYPDPNRLVRVYTTHVETGLHTGSSIPDYMDWNDLSTRFDLMAGYRRTAGVVDGQLDERVSLIRGGPELLSLIGMRPVVGRLILRDDTRLDATPIVVLAHEFWMSRFGGDPDVIGRQVRIERGTGRMQVGIEAGATREVTYTVVGVAEPLPPGNLFQGVEAILPWVIESDSNRESRQWRNLNILARLGEDVSLDDAQAELDRIGSVLAEQYTEQALLRPVAVSLHDEIVSDARPKLIALAGATGLILLLAVANIANLFLVRGSARRDELLVRASLGAGRVRLMRFLVTESLLVALVGGIAGIAFGSAAIRFLLSWAPNWIPRLEEIHIDGVVLAVALAVTVVCGLICGLVPVASLRRSLLVRTGRVAGGPVEADGGWTGGLLVVSQIVFSLVLLTGSGLMVRSFLALQDVPIGIDHEQVVTFSFTGGFSVGRSAESRTAELRQYQAALEHIRTIPGVRSATLSSHPPLSASWGGETLTVMSGATRGETQQVDLVGVSPEFFEFVDSETVAGRLFDASDVSRADDIVVVDENLARRMWPDEPAPGQRIEIGDKESVVIGVVEPIRYGDLAEDMRPKLFHLLNRDGGVFGNVALIRHDGRAGPIMTAIEARLAEVSLEPRNLRPLAALFDQYLREPRFYLWLMGILGGLALAVATVGIYGVVAYAVACRTGEIGVRMALGAGRGRIATLFCRRIVALLAIGLSGGLAVSVWLTRYIESLLFETEPTDPLAMASMAVLLAATAMVATLIPVRRAFRIDPARTLRQE